MFKRDSDGDDNETGLDKEVLLCIVVCLVCIVCSRTAGHCDGCAGLLGHAKHGVKVFHYCVFDGAVQSVGGL